ncbi:unnamed protein product [Anisakis simplex]|uniref:EGF-like domain-containing protein n=1 Tax=Anisakis simplex TaxID=6269 RepID=A0A3P6SKU9_ANISI|nr:unnamed protein product [Anisakis simplex]
MNLSVSSFKCICGSEYAGELCQYKVNDFCKGQHCDEGTVCTVTNGFAECVSYESLAYFSSCDETFCLNGAQCVPAINNRFKCLCADVDSSAHIATFSITTTVFLFGLVLLIVLSVLLICHSSNIGCYLLMPGESNYTRWDDEDGEPDDDRIPLEMIRSGTQYDFSYNLFQ